MKATDTSLSIGSTVVLKDHSAKERHKIQDIYGQDHFKVVDRPDPEGNVYVIESVDEKDGFVLRKTVGRSELKDISKLETTQNVRQEDADTTETLHTVAGNCDDDEAEEITLDFQQPPVDNFMPGTDEGDSDLSDGDIRNEPLRRSSRTTAEKHRNPFRLPRSAVGEASEIDARKHEALMNLSRAHFALVEMLKSTSNNDL